MSKVEVDWEKDAPFTVVNNGFLGRNVQILDKNGKPVDWMNRVKGLTYEIAGKGAAILTIEFIGIPVKVAAGNSTTIPMYDLSIIDSQIDRFAEAAGLNSDEVADARKRMKAARTVVEISGAAQRRANNVLIDSHE